MHIGIHNQSTDTTNILVLLAHYTSLPLHVLLSSNLDTRIRAVVQNLNTEFSEFFRKVAQKYHIGLDKDGLKPFDPNSAEGYGDRFVVSIAPIRMTKENT